MEEAGHGVTTHGGYIVGDYFVADKPEYDVPDGKTYKVVALGHNLLGRELVHLVDITTMNSIQPSRNCFYPHELSYEDGSLPVR
mgnify:CR=1 FL=1